MANATGVAPRELGPEHLVLSHFSLAREHPIEERIAVAASAGFAGIGLFVGQYRALELEGAAPGPLRDLLAEHDICLAEIEVIPGLGRDGPGADRAAEMEETAWRMADEFACRYMQVIGPANSPVTEAGRAYGSLCDRAADHGLVVGLEFLPFTDIVSVHDALAIVEAADRPNGGICVDIWHHQRGEPDLDAIRHLDARLVTGVQMSDGALVPANPDYYTECLTNRVAPGRGEFDVAGFVAAIRATGSRAPWSLEVCSSDGWADPGAHVAAIASGMRAFLE